jgi:simple sugar transport system ATP-binding protein
MEDITKIYWQKELKANDSVTLEVNPREIHAIVGENGAGKSTLMKVLYGLEQPDGGRIFLDGKEREIRNPLDANNLGIGMVHQHFKLVPEFTVAENVVLGIEPIKNGVFINRQEARKRVEEVIRHHGFSIDARKRVESLTVGQMQQVEIIKMLYRKVDLLILDEPTSVLTEQEIDALFETLRRLRSKGKTIIIITHKLGEVKRISDRVTVMRKGRVVALENTSEVSERELSKLMVGREVLFQIKKSENACGAPVVELKDITLRQFGHGRPLLDRVSLTVRSCEVVGIAGVSGNGLGELEDVVTGLRRADSGRYIFEGKDVAGLDTLQLREKGLAYVPADRLHRGSSSVASVRENIMISRHHDFIRGGIIRGKDVQNFTDSLIEQFSIDGTGSAPIGTLSGGNIQKVILARELATKTNFIVFSEPTWGLDVASSQFVYEKILELRERGCGVLMISSNLDEILGIADTVAIMYRGRVVGNRPNDSGMDKELIGEYMLGIRDDYTETENEDVST